MNTMTSRMILGVAVRPADAVLLGTYGVFAGLTALFPGRVENQPRVLLEMALCLIGYAVLNFLSQRAGGRWARFLLRTAAVQGLIFFVYRASLFLVHVLVSRWYDLDIIRLEDAVFGIQPTIWLESRTVPGLTEWLMFCYVFYVAIYPILSVIIFLKHGEDKNEEYLFFVSLVVALSTGIALCLPVAGPAREASGLAFNVPLRGGPFTAVGELIRARVHRPGGAFPSIHCSAATIMWWTAWRFSRPTFYVMAPIVLSLYVSTVYGRFHYVSDSVAGIACAFLAMLFGQMLLRAWNRAKVGHADI